MPPASPPSHQQNTIDDNSPLSDEAEQDSDVQAHPFRSIFAAYDTVLAQYGLDPDHDQIYLRFLLRLGGKRQNGKALYENFESLLAELGIQIEINTEENEIQDVTRSINAAIEDSPDLQTRSEAGSNSGIRSRRASFHSMVEAENEGSKPARIRSSSRASITGFHRDQIGSSTDRPSTRATIRPTERYNRQSLLRQPAAESTRGRLTAREFASNLQHYQRRRASASDSQTHVQMNHRTTRRQSRTQSAQRSLVQAEVNLASAGNDSQGFWHEEEREGDGVDRNNRLTGNYEQAYRADHRELFYQPNETQLLRDVDTFQHFKMRAVLRDSISRWRVVMLDSRKLHDLMDHRARNYDLATLLRQSFDLWRSKLQLNVQAAAAERYYLQLEQRAHKARDLYLITKAFTHWQQVAFDRVKCIKEARHQILRVKYFNAWLEHTVVNQQKVRRQGQRKLYSLWHQRYSNSLEQGGKASLTRTRNLLKTAYWKWFWSFCERRAPQWHNGRLRSSLFSHWALFSQRRSYQEYEATVRRDHVVKKICFTKWLQQARFTLSKSREADMFRQQKIAARSLLECRKAIRYAPLVRQVTNMADWRIAGSTFASLVNIIRTQQQANKVNELRVMRNAWTAWNDRLRWQTLEDQIDDRVLVQTLYRWVLAERCILQQRLREQRIMHTCLRKLIDGHRARAKSRRAIGDGLSKKRQVRILRSIIHSWRHCVNVCLRDAQIAFNFEAPRIAQEAISAWTAKRNHLCKLEKWAVDASYYFRTVRFIRLWRAAAAEVKRQKIRDAYAQVRRQNKVKLVRSCLQIWSDRTQRVTDMEEHSGSYDQSRLLGIGTSLFDHWRNRHSFLVDRQNQTTLEFDQRFAHNQLDKWIERHRSHAQKEELARVNAELRISNVAFGWLHKLHLRVIELKGRESNAESLRRWYEKRHFHNLLRQWHERLAKRRDQPLPPPVYSSRARRLGLRSEAEGQEEAAGRAEEWTAFDEGFNLGDWIPALDAQASSTTPLPGYLSTPSKRAARARGLVRMSTTPAGTPFAARLHLQLGKEPRSVRRGDLGRSNAGFSGSAFGPIPETSPRTPGGS
ncbi:MAG: hypothetical protein Q9179_000218 [Wetmoreana sp. 5 TL-2023]